MDDTTAREFGEFVAGRTHALFRTAYALTGNQHAAEDLLQNALAKAALHWRRIRSNEEAYVRRIMYRDFISAWRWRTRRPERVEAEVPDAGQPGDHASQTVQRLTLYAAIRRLPPRQRAVLVLRYLEDLSEQQVAEALGCSVGTVGSQLSRALSSLRGDPELNTDRRPKTQERQTRKEAYTL